MENQAQQTEPEQVDMAVRKPKKVLHFSDGVEEFSDDEEERDLPDQIDSLYDVDESSLTWGPWLMLKTRQTGQTILNGCDYLGETLASVLGITSPKFVDVEEELKKAELERKRIEEEDVEEQYTATWTTAGQKVDLSAATDHTETIDHQPPPAVLCY